MRRGTNIGALQRDADKLLNLYERAEDDARALEKESITVEERGRDDLATLDADVLTGDATEAEAALKRQEVTGAIESAQDKAARGKALLAPLKARLVEAGNRYADALIEGARAAFDAAAGEQAAAAEVLRLADRQVEAADAALDEALRQSQQVRGTYDFDEGHRQHQAAQESRRRIEWCARQGPGALPMIPETERPAARALMEEGAARMREIVGDRETEWPRIPQPS